jgi:hypothetical protein
VEKISRPFGGKMIEEEKIEPNEIEIASEEAGEVQLWKPGKPTISFLRCKSCYLRKECPYYDVNSTSCAIKALEEVDTTTGEGIISIVQQMLKIQAERVFRFVKVEEMEGGLPDPNVTNELMVFVSLVEKLKKILSDDDYLVIRTKGKATQSVLERLFGDLGKED